MNKKESGSFYTPEILSNFLVQHIFQTYLTDREVLRILEPSCGDGEFIESLKPFIANIDVELDIIDVNKDELTKSFERISQVIPNQNIRCNNSDFLEFEFQNSYSLIIGNPPYISKKHLSVEQIELCKTVCKPYITGEVKNIWPAFLVKAIENIDEDGVMCFVLPSELLQVKYTSGLRKLILESFDKVEIFAFNELIFDNAEQDVVAIIGIKSHDNQEERGVSFYQVDKLEDLTIPNYTKMNFNVHREKLDKWTNYILTDDQLNSIDNVSSDLGLLPIRHYCQKAEVGIVTAANKYFIKRQSELIHSNLDRYVRPILQKSNLLHQIVTITQERIEQLRDNDKPVNLVCFDNVPKNQLSEDAQRFVTEGEIEGLHERYKMTKRVNWYHVPSIWSSEAIFCKRSHLFPRMLLNKANVLVTDSFYRVICKDEYSIQKLVFSFYNSMTMVLAELEGRFYGGGVLELIPTEFKNLLIPYNGNVTQRHYEHLEELFHDNASLDEILNYTDPILLQGIETEQINDLRDMREALFNRRTKHKPEHENVNQITI